WRHVGLISHERVNRRWGATEKRFQVWQCGQAFGPSAQHYSMSSHFNLRHRNHARNLSLPGDVASKLIDPITYDILLLCYFLTRWVQEFLSYIECPLRVGICAVRRQQPGLEFLRQFAICIFQFSLCYPGFLGPGAGLLRGLRPYEPQERAKTHL